MTKFLLKILLPVIVLSSCSREISSSAEAQVKFINASINSASLDATFDGVLLVQNLSFGNASNYFFPKAGNPTIKISGYSTGTIYAVGQTKLEENVNYTIIATDSITKMKASILQDTVTSPASGKTNIRFFHLANDVAALDFYVAGVKINSSRSFNDQSGNTTLAKFISINAVATTTIEAKLAGTNTVVATYANANLQDGKIYTLVLKGTTNGAVGSAQAVSFSIVNYN